MSYGENSVSASTTSSAADTSTRVGVAYAWGTAGLTALIASTSFFQVFFLTDVAAVPAALVSGALLVGKLWDVVNDPLLGLTLDRTRRRFPLRRWLMLGSLPLAVGATCLWVVPPDLPVTLRVVWVVAAYFAFDTAFTAVQLAFNTLGAEATAHYDARTRLMAFGAIGGVVGYLVGAAGFEAAKRAFTVPATAFGAAGVVLGLLAGSGVMVAGMVLPERPARAGTTTPGLRGALALLRCRPFLLLAVPMAFARVGFTVLSAALPYFAKYHLRDERLAAGLVVALMAVVALMVPVWRRLADRTSKTTAYAWSLAWVSVALGLTWFVPVGSPWPIFGAVALVGFGMAGHWVLPWSILPDIIDWDELETNERRAGLYLGVFGLLDKLARTVGVVAVGWLLAGGGFVPNTEQSSTALSVIRLMFGPLPAVCVMLAVPVLLRFPVDRAAHERVRQALEARRGADTLQEEALESLSSEASA